MTQPLVQSVTHTISHVESRMIALDDLMSFHQCNASSSMYLSFISSQAQFETVPLADSLTPSAYQQTTDE